MLHTLPPRKSDLAKKQKKSNEAAPNDKALATEVEAGVEDCVPLPVERISTHQDEASPKSRSSLSYATLTIPKLVSCVEIIKREWIKIQKTKIQGKPWPKVPKEEELVHGLEQYNEISCLEEVDDDDFIINRTSSRGLQDVPDDKRPEMIVKLLNRKKL